MKNKDLIIKCVTLIGPAEDWGKHILLLPLGSTLCGMPTKDSTDPILQNEHMKDLIHDYKVEPEFDITCEKCLSVFTMLQEHKRKQN